MRRILLQKKKNSNSVQCLLQVYRFKLPVLTSKGVLICLN